MYEHRAASERKPLGTAARGANTAITQGMRNKDTTISGFDIDTESI
jgi:hypothetical protein